MRIAPAHALGAGTWPASAEIDARIHRCKSCDVASACAVLNFLTDTHCYVSLPDTVVLTP